MFRGLFDRSGVLVAAAVGVISGFYLFDKPLREAASRVKRPNDGAAW